MLVCVCGVYKIVVFGFPALPRKYIHEVVQSSRQSSSRILNNPGGGPIPSQQQPLLSVTPQLHALVTSNLLSRWACLFCGFHIHARRCNGLFVKGFFLLAYRFQG